jgi:uncharacterized protein YndB with AHSA1/START domain
MEARIEKQIEIAAPVSRVWQALTDSSQFSQWFTVTMEGPFLAGQPVTGKCTGRGYEHVRLQIVVQEIKPETYFSYKWHPYALDTTKDYSQETPTLVEFHLSEIPSGTLLAVTESGFDKLPQERYADALRMNTRGWEQQMNNINSYVSKTS